MFFEVGGIVLLEDLPRLARRHGLVLGPAGGVGIAALPGQRAAPGGAGEEALEVRMAEAFDNG
jgi:hypothetical protein